MSLPESTQQRLERSRAELGLWFDHDRTKRDAFARSGLGQVSALPWVRHIVDHPLASLALGALTKWWMKPREARPLTAGVFALGTGLRLMRRRPVLAMSTVAVLVALAWAQLRKHPPRPFK
jgi:hypothetical protein